MAVEPQLSDQEIASLMEVPQPAMGLGGSVVGTSQTFAHDLAHAGEHLREPRNPTWMR